MLMVTLVAVHIWVERSNISRLSFMDYQAARLSVITVGRGRSIDHNSDVTTRQMIEVPI